MFQQKKIIWKFIEIASSRSLTLSKKKIHPHAID
jgi:hypothetical protein